MTARRRTGILGGTFDPIHTGHVALASAAQERLALTAVCVIPSNIPPHRPQPLASSFHRFAMAALTVAGRSGWSVSDVELLNDGPSYTTDTIRWFHERGYQAAELFFIIGADAFADIAKWKDYPAILERTQFAVVARPGTALRDLPPQLSQHPSIFLIDAPTPDVSATAIRQQLASGRPVDGMVEPRVQQHIDQHGLYASLNPGRWADDRADTPAAGRLHGQG